MWPFSAGRDIPPAPALVRARLGDDPRSGGGRLPYLLAVGPVSHVAAVAPAEQDAVRLRPAGELFPRQRARARRMPRDMHPDGRRPPLGQRDIALPVVLRQREDVLGA